MKQSFLLLAAGLLAATANGQQAEHSAVFTGQKPAPMPGKVVTPKFPGFKNHSAPLVNGRTTSGTDGRWYNYGGEYLFALTQVSANSGTVVTGSDFPYMWFDTSSQDIYAGPSLGFNNLVSIGNVTDPTISGWNAGSAGGTITPTDGFLAGTAITYADYEGGGLIGVGATNAYTVDSIEVVGTYGYNLFNTSRAAYLYDTLRVEVTYGQKASTSSTSSNILEGYFNAPIDEVATGRLYFETLEHDSTLDIATGTAPAITTHVDILLSASSNVDTDASTYRGGSLIYTGLYHKTVALPTALSVPANDLIGASVTFISGDPTAPKVGGTHFGDTVFTGDTGNPFRHGMFRPFVVFMEQGGGSTTTAYPMYLLPEGDENEGVYKTEVADSWGGSYIPMYAYNQGGGPSALQYTTIGYHVVCPTCDTVGAPPLATKNVVSTNSIKVYPNPANNVLNITYSLVQSAPVTITLTNMIGQVVATQQMAAAANGNAVINTNTLPSGLYIYTMNANGALTTGRVSVAH